MKALYLSILLCLALPGAAKPAKKAPAQPAPAPWSVRMVDSEMARHPRPTTLDNNPKAKWTYTVGMELQAMLDTYTRYGNDRIKEYVIRYADTMVNAKGEILTYKKEDYNVDMVCSGVMLIRVYEMTGEKKYKAAADLLRKQLWEQPRTSGGAFWHKNIYPHQIWLDGLYMAAPFYAEYVSRYECDTEQKDDFKDIANLFLETAKHTYDPATGLYRHAWDEARSQPWADPVTGLSPCVWGRAMGWYTMALVEALDYLPASTKGYKEMVSILQGIYDVLPRYRDPKTGMWFQVLDQGAREGNYVEATCSSMFTYAMLKAVRQGHLPADRLTEAMANYDNLIKTFVREEPDGKVTLTQCCQVAGLGGKQNRSGTFEYYMSEPIVDNDPKGTAPFIWASLEHESLMVCNAATAPKKGKKSK